MDKSTRRMQMNEFCKKFTLMGTKIEEKIMYFIEKHARIMIHHFGGKSLTDKIPTSNVLFHHTCACNAVSSLIAFFHYILLFIQILMFENVTMHTQRAAFSNSIIFSAYFSKIRAMFNTMSTFLS